MAATKSKLSQIIAALGPFLILGFVLGLFAAIMNADSRETFFSLYNFKTILTQTVIVAIGALGMTMIIVIPSDPIATITVCVRIVLKL